MGRLKEFDNLVRLATWGENITTEDPRLAWSPTMEDKAKGTGRVLVKFHVRNRNGHNNFVSGPVTVEKAKAMHEITYLNDDNPKLARILAILEED